jgi:hypothetical protein
LHVARTVVRRAERLVAQLAAGIGGRPQRVAGHIDDVGHGIDQKPDRALVDIGHEHDMGRRRRGRPGFR